VDEAAERANERIASATLQLIGAMILALQLQVSETDSGDNVVASSGRYQL
jgi:hypothetical protein